MDPLSVAGSVVGVISLGMQVTRSLVDFYKAYKHQNSELAGMTGRLESLVDTFQHLELALSGRRFQVNERSPVKRIETSIVDCNELIQELQEECQKFIETSSKGVKAAIKVTGRRATYPFRQSTLKKVDEDISEIRANLSFALDVLQFNDSRGIQDDLIEMRTVLDLVKSNQISSDLRDWLSAPDVTIDHNAACAKKFPGTGKWLVESLQFLEWLTEENSIVWLRGFAGCGKSVLCSTAIQSVLRHRGSDRGIAIAFFYFAFNDDSKQDVSSMIRALLLQLSNQLQDGHADLMRLHDSYRTGIPPFPMLLAYLQRLIQRFRHVYILLDALDESPRTAPRVHILNALETMRKWGMQHLHLFVDSTPLLQAARQGHQLTVRLLSEHGASALEQDSDQRTALYWASVSGHEKAAEELLLGGADTSITDEKGKTLLHWAAEGGFTPMVILLLDGGAVISNRDNGGSTALHLAAEKGDQEMIKLLISKGAEVSPVDQLSRTPLHCSAERGYGEATKLLVDGGPLVSTVDGAGRTARDLVKEKGLERTIKALDGEQSTVYVFEGRLVLL